MIVLLMLTQAVLLFYGTQLFFLGGWLDKFRFVCYGLIISAGLLFYPKFKFRRPTRVDFIAFLLLMFAFYSYSFSFEPKLTLLRSTANLLMYIAIFWTLWISCRNSSEVRNYVQALIWVWIVYYGINVAFLFFRPQDSFQIHEAEYIGFAFKRFNGLTISPNAIGVFSAIILPVVLWNFQYKKTILSLFLLLSVAFSFFYSFARDAFICGILGSSLYFYISTRVHRVFIIVCTLASILLMIFYVELFGLFLPPGLIRIDNLLMLGGRVEAWQAALELIHERPWRGYGFGVEELLFDRFHYVFQVHAGGTVHNSFLGLALQIGLFPTIIFYLSLVVFLIKSFQKIMKLESQYRPLMSALYASTFCGFITSFFESWVGSAGGIIAFPFFMILMLLMKLLEFEENKIYQPIMQLSSHHLFFPPKADLPKERGPSGQKQVVGSSPDVLVTQ